MAKNRKFAEARHLSLTASHPTTPLSGQPLRVGDFSGVAMTDERADGTTTADLGPAVYGLSVKGVNDSGNSAVAVGDALYYVDADIGSGTGFLSKKSSGRFFGYALAVVNSGATATIDVLKAPTVGAQIPAGSVSAAQVATVANGNVIGGVPVMHRITAAALTGDVDVVLTYKTRVTSVYCVATAAGGAGDTVTVKNGATAITDAMDLNVSDKVIVRAATLDDAQWDIAAGGTLRVSGASAVTAEVFVTGLLVP